MEHPVTPPPELVEKWRDEALNSFPDDENPCPCDIDDARDEHIATQAARWGADQELEACCEWLRNTGLFETRIGHLRAARRPKPQSLKEQALEALAAIQAGDAVPRNGAQTNAIRHALEALPD